MGVAIVASKTTLGPLVDVDRIFEQVGVRQGSLRDMYHFKKLSIRLFMILLGLPRTPSETLCKHSVD